MTKSDTPMMRQYRDAKTAHPGMMVFFRNGDFYELFEDDAELGARLLGITLTKRDKEIPMAGVPHHALDRYLNKLIQAGHRVAICEQMEDASQAKGIIRREVTRVVTAGTVTEDALLDPRQSNHLAAVVVRKGGVGLAWVDLTAGSIWAADVPHERLADELARLSPAECLHPESDAERLADAFQAAPPRTLTPRPDWTFEPTTTRRAICDLYGVATLAGFGFAADDQPGCVAAGALVLYLRETLKTPPTHLRPLKPFCAERFLLLDEVTRRSLELTRTLRDGGREGSLLSAIDRTATPMGARLLAEWLVAPLAERPAIEERLDAVAEFNADHRLRTELRDLLKDAFDLQRLTARVSTGRASPRDLAAVTGTLRLLPRLKAKLAGRRSALLSRLDGKLELFHDLREALDAALVDEPPLSAKEGELIRDGYSPELDDLRGIARDGKLWLTRFQADEIARTGIPSLKVGYNQVFGYYIEITHAQGAKAPSNYTRKQTLKNAERYVTPELKEYEEKVLGAQERIHTLEYELFVALREKATAQTDRLLTAAEVLATLDVLASLAELAASRNYVRPELADAPVLRVSEGRHPVLDQTLPPGAFVPNDLCLTAEDGWFWLVTGPNMAGKSTFLRQAALVTLLAHMGSFVPAKAAMVGVTDRIFTRVGASDELSRGQSTFMVEMTEAANILNNATPRSLVILDEIGRGTSTYDGVSLAWAITEHLHDAIGCRALFATHYHELAQLAEALPGLRNHNVLVREQDDTVVFLHRIAPGSAGKSYGIHVARLAGVPAGVLQRAHVVLAELESRHKLNAGPRPIVVPPPERAGRRKRPTSAGPSLFGESVDG
ncbi:MAG: DNA mismatch repair protein MutS [Gemmataceae bacterium]